MTDEQRAARFRGRIGVPALIDSHTHFMPERLLAAVQSYFDSAGPLVGREWPIRYRMGEDDRVSALRGLGVRAFTGSSGGGPRPSGRGGIRCGTARRRRFTAGMGPSTLRSWGWPSATRRCCSTPRWLEALGDRILFGSDFPNIPYSYADALEAPEKAGLSAQWLRAVCHDNAAALFGLGFPPGE